MDDLPSTMRAVRCCGPEDYRLEEVAVPSPGAGEALIRVEACGICASDVKCFTGAPLFWGDEKRPRYVDTPVTPGHEFVGRIVAVGEGVRDLRVGDRAISEQIVPCWECRYCRTGSYHLCAANRIYGFRTPTQGGMAEYMLFPRGALNHRVPDSLPVEQAALIEPLACSMHAVERAQIQLGDVAVIAGAGPLGLGMVACAKLKSPKLLIVIDKFEERRRVAERLGADITMSPDGGDVVEDVRALTDGYGCDAYIEATGHPDGVGQGLQMVRKGGNFVEFSVMAREAPTDWTLIGDVKELNIFGAHLGPYCYATVIEYLASGKLKTDGIVTHRLPLEQYLEGFHMVHDGRRSIKVLLDPTL